MEIRNSTALVTGGASGLGAATARALRDRGARVVICDIREEAGQSVFLPDQIVDKFRNAISSGTRTL